MTEFIFMIHDLVTFHGYKRKGSHNRLQQQEYVQFGHAKRKTLKTSRGYPKKALHNAKREIMHYAQSTLDDRTRQENAKIVK
jgi:hypothetical protein